MAEHPHLQMESAPHLRTPLLVLAWSGWNDAGEAASQAVRSLISTLDAQLFATIDPEDYYDFTQARPLARYRDGEREIVWPSTEFFAARLPELPRDLILGAGVEPNHRWKSYMGAITELIGATQVELVVTLGAFAAPVPHTRPVAVRGSANASKLADRYQLHPSRYEGPTGVVGVFHDFCRQRGIDGISFWASVPHYLPGARNPMATRSLLEKFAELSGLTVNYEYLDKEIDGFQRRMRTAVEQNERLASYIRRLEEVQGARAPADADVPPGAPLELPSAEGLIEELEDFLRESRRPDS